MTTPAYAELVSAVRREGEALVAAARQGSEAAVPTCGAWTVADLARHVWQVYANVTMYVTTRATRRPDQFPELPDGDPVDLLEAQLDQLVAALSDVAADTPIWTWVFDAPAGAVFWARRMAHESAVHRFDAQNAHGIQEPINAELAGDGIDELVDVIAPRVYGRDELSGPTGSLALHSTDGDAWFLELHPSGVRKVERLESPAVTATGTSSGLLLTVYGRVPISTVEVTGDASLLEAWTDVLNF
ncbi:MAG TPA: maleylpyruvate isomerase family mycothiol-dependent enzyme [Mycobacteriales bacterium]|nr:maleylpyruvate isomerase family mycothiol-dependent enzyme [Mycobacteriales bacterium]